MRQIALLASLLFAASSFAAPAITQIHPNEGFTFGGTEVTISGSGFGTQAVGCPVPPPGGTGPGTCPAEVWFGDVRAVVRSVTPTTIRLFVPQQDARTVDVRVRVDGAGEVVAPNAFTFAADAVPGYENYTPMMLPLIPDQTLGANGSIWATELLIWNSSSHVLMPVNLCEPILMTVPCQPYAIQPGETRNDFLVGRYGGGEGMFLYIPKPLTGAAGVSLRVRDVSVDARSWGAAIPVVGFDEFKPGLALIDIPTDARYRVTLRVYSQAQAPQSVRVTVLSERNEVLDENVILLNGIVTVVPVEFPLEPAYAQLNPVSAAVRAAAPRVRIELDNMGANVSPPPPPIWAFVSITHNETQQVTIVAPN